jgi:hypothetical protein
MDNIIWGVAAGLGVVSVLFVIFFIWESVRSAYFTVAAKWYGWSKEEKRERLIARERRMWARDERQAERDKIASGDLERRRYGVAIATGAIAGMAFQMNLPWWNASSIAVAAYVGLTMAAGLSFKWW